MVNHPEEIIDASMNDVGGLTALGAKMEHSLCMFVKESKLKVLEAEDLRKHIEAAGVDNTIMSTDLGQTGNIRPLDGFRHGIALCLDLGYSAADIRKMFSTNAAKLFGLEKLVANVARTALAIRGRDCRQLGHRVSRVRAQRRATRYSENFRFPSFTTVCHILISSAIRWRNSSGVNCRPD